jgi:hypothetical protein
MLDLEMSQELEVMWPKLPYLARVALETGPRSILLMFSS